MKLGDPWNFPKHVGRRARAFPFGPHCVAYLRFPLSIASLSFHSEKRQSPLFERSFFMNIGLNGSKVPLPPSRQLRLPDSRVQMECRISIERDCRPGLVGPLSPRRSFKYNFLVNTKHSPPPNTILPCPEMPPLIY